jgi:hypothetical protein
LFAEQASPKAKKVSPGKIAGMAELLDYFFDTASQLKSVGAGFGLEFHPGTKKRPVLRRDLIDRCNIFLRPSDTNGGFLTHLTTNEAFYTALVSRHDARPSVAGSRLEEGRQKQLMPVGSCNTCGVFRTFALLRLVFFCGFYDHAHDLPV